MNPTDAPNRIELSGKTHPLTMAIVDDDPRVRELLKEEIQDEGHHVLSFESAESFLDNSSLESIDLVLLDLMMPGMNGLECLQQLHHRQAFHHKLPRIVVVSALSDPIKHRQVLKAGAESYVIKPDLFERLPALLNGASP
ncbi:MULTISPECIES: response regulator [Prochlorococcus]|uniref:response regulator n=1 Tax=Prochlorococcus TaxID=1218 RepID=UPI0007B3F3DE|nr:MULTISPECIES: response regulator [Prochlorococcus]KZR62777.1 Sensory/regulatory protein RpfC [Prochlorococcus marinus str. MIT 1312]KZR80742.1 Sensory/regulatory protein RpfC [Prochlorococcus marinus str. MIT 1327]NMO85169.1 response regulator [Prochlorococcus sp. P1344]NMP07098.1 response regulator [Prochlorococcus sp. P1361]NMP14357.1 response regulator [Prochlorococcus sp.P1363]